MKRIRIGKDIAISWEINSPMDLVDTDLTIQMKDPKGNKVDILDFELVDKTISFGLRGTAFAYLGNYTLTLWYKKGEVGQTVVDVVGAFELVGSTEQEDEGCNCGCGALDVSTVDLYGDLTFPIIEGPKGDKGDPFTYDDFTPEQLEELKGTDGFSPIATVSKSGETATISITDKNGTTTTTIRDGQDAPAVEEIFWATYGTTTATEIQTAIDAGKAVMCKRNVTINSNPFTIVYTLESVDQNTCYFISNILNGNYIYRLTLNKNTSIWNNSSSEIQQKSIITSSSSTTPSDSNYYSALATKNLVDAVDAKIGPAVSFTYTYTDDTTQTYNLLTSNN